MKFLVFVLVCITTLCCCQAGVDRGATSDVIVINNTTETVPESIITNDTQNSEITTHKGYVTVSVPPPPPPPTTVNPNKTTTSKTPTTSPVTTSTTSLTPTTSPTTTPAPTSTTTTQTSTAKPTSTMKPTSSTTKQPTSSPVITTTTGAPSNTNRGFDGPSFIGGIVLASGLMAIGFVSFKFYKARTELNYHTL